MDKKAILVLEDGTIFEGFAFGCYATATGEVVFDTAMAGYQEMLTDPSFAGQIVVPTYPLIGNYGINDTDIESAKIQVRGFVVREYCKTPSHWQNKKDLDTYLKDNNIPGLSGVDTRALTRHIRSLGAMMGILSSELTIEEAKRELKRTRQYGVTDFIKEVTTEKLYRWNNNETDANSKIHILIIDMGMKYNIARILCQLKCKVTIVPAFVDIDRIFDINPDGILLSPGPGDPSLLDYAIKLVRRLIEYKPLMGICLGHQLIALSLEAKTYKLKFGHRGSNHPVLDLSTGRIYITTQNHGYAVDADTLRNGLEVSHVNSNDGTVEGLRHKELPVFSIQYHSEGAPGPQDSYYQFNHFINIIRNRKN